MNLRTCPFCGSSKIDLSMTVSESIRNRYYKVAYYCKNCNTYGPRVIYKPEDPKNRYLAEKELQKEDSPIRLEAEKLWNSRSNSDDIKKAQIELLEKVKSSYWAAYPDEQMFIEDLHSDIDKLIEELKNKE